MDPLDILLKSSQETGLDIEIKRQGPNGCLAPVRKNEIAALHTKSKIASTAQLLQKLTDKEKLEWAIETKNEGNQLYSCGDYKGAIDKYVEALTATSFDQDGNIYQLAVPVLYQALKLDHCCEKALYRKSVGLIRLAEFEDAIAILKSLNNLSTELKEQSGEADDIRADEKSLTLSMVEKKKIPYWLKIAYDGRKREKESLVRQRENLKKVFGGSTQKHLPSEEKDELEPMSLIEFVMFVWECICAMLSRLFGRIKEKR